jgi:hypothetical protein
MVVLPLSTWFQSGDLGDETAGLSSKSRNREPRHADGGPTTRQIRSRLGAENIGLPL